MAPPHAVFNEFPVMDLGDVVLRQLELTDARPFYKYISDPEVNKFVSDEDLPKSLKHAEDELKYWGDLFKYKRSIYWAIARKENGKMIGTCGFNTWSRTHARVEISYDLARIHWGKGIMTRAIQAVCSYAFSAMHVNRIQATVATDNAASRRVLEKLGFQEEALLRQYGILHGQKKDFYMTSLLVGDASFGL